MRRLIFLTLVFTLFVQLTHNAQAQSTYFIVQKTYFSFIPALPISIPQNEQPGDVYTRPGVIFARKADCFKEATTDSSDTYFPTSIVVGSYNTVFQVGGEYAAIAKAAAEAGTQISNNVSVSYGENGKGKWSQIVERDLLAVLQSPKTNDCREKFYVSCGRLPTTSLAYRGLYSPCGTQPSTSPIKPRLRWMPPLRQRWTENLRH